MKSRFKYYVIIWAVLVAIFNVIVFVTPNEVAGLSKFRGAFWTGYIFIMLTFVGQLAAAWYSLKGGITRTFYRMPLLAISYGSLIAMMIVGVLCMVIPNFPVWLGIIICLLVLAFSVLSVVQAQAAALVVEDVDTKIKDRTFFIRSLTVDLESLMARVTVQEIADDVKKVYETVRYSDPVSNEALFGVETQITLKVNELQEEIEKMDFDKVKRIAREVVILLNDRNKKCKLLK